MHFFEKRAGGRELGTLLALGCALLAGGASGEVINVAAGESIQAGLALAAPGDTVVVQCGVYHESGLVVPDGALLISESGEPDCVTIATGGNAPAFICEDMESGPDMVGLTVTRGPRQASQELLQGGGLLCRDASVTFSNCRFEGLYADYGAVVFCEGESAPQFLACVFRDNHASAVGGVLAAVGNGLPRFYDCLVVQNEAGHAGGAFNLARGAELLLHGCTVADNSGAANALSCWGNAHATAMNSIVSDDGVWQGDSSGLIHALCSDMYSATEMVPLADYSSDTITEDPLFCGTMAGDHKYDLAEASPCTPEALPGCGGMGARPVGCGLSSVDDPPSSFTRLQDCFPNPFNPTTTIRFELARDGQVSLAVYNLAGRLVRQLVQETRAAGAHEAVWRGRDARGHTVAAGVYFVRLKTGDTVDTRRVTMVK